ncbi:MAG: hypothetical protein JO303_18150 [Caulobacteraceae bacterium]|nr:hypothetical protein [Caulobacteraceae bacterium]
MAAKPKGAASVAASDRPPALEANEETLRALGRFGEVQCPPEEAAQALGSDLADLKRLFRQSKLALRTYRTARARGIVALREAQFKLAATSVPMAMMLAKTYLGHDERRESDESVPTDHIGAAQRVRAKLAAIAAQDAPPAGVKGDGDAG